MSGEVFARGRFGEISRLDDGKILKLYFEGYSKEKAVLEFNNAKIACETGCTPIKVYELVEKDGRWGFTMDFCPGMSFNDIAMKKPAYLFKSGKLLAEQHALVHSKKSHELNDIRIICCNILDTCKHFDFLTADEKERTKKYIMDLPEEDSIIHLDLHTANVMVDDDDVCRIIDWTTACRGNRAVEMALMQFFFSEAELFAEASDLKNWIYDKLRKIVGKPFMKEYQRLMPISQDEVDRYAILTYIFRREWDLVTEREKLGKHIKRFVEERCK